MSVGIVDTPVAFGYIAASATLLRRGHSQFSLQGQETRLRPVGPVTALLVRIDQHTVAVGISFVEPREHLLFVAENCVHIGDISRLHEYARPGLLALVEQLERFRLTAFQGQPECTRRVDPAVGPYGLCTVELRVKILEPPRLEVGVGPGPGRPPQVRVPKRGPSYTGRWRPPVYQQIDKLSQDNWPGRVKAGPSRARSAFHAPHRPCVLAAQDTRCHSQNAHPHPRR